MDQEAWSSDDQEKLSAVVKGVHAGLRAQLATGLSTPDGVWSSHLEDEAYLTNYASAMHQLACGPWADKNTSPDEGRITWCVETCREYFYCSLERLIRKDFRRMHHEMPTQVHSAWLPSAEEDVMKVVSQFAGRKLVLLDVGSCYNPFSQFDEFSVTAIDIAPAVEGVIKCDFLSVPLLKQDVSSSPSIPFNPTGSGLILYESSHDVVVFSLLLSYFPCSSQRLRCCHKAHSLLRVHGLLLIITPDSSHQNKHTDMMKSWRAAIESIGFHRCVYHKSQHLHCMAFRKTHPSSEFSSLLKDYRQSLYIPQDLNTISQQPSNDSLSKEESKSKAATVQADFSELPRMDSN